MDPGTVQLAEEDIQAVRCLHLHVHPDRQGITQWINGWQRNGWKTAAKKPVKNQDLWQQLLAAIATHEVEWHWVKGHSGHAENERVDQAANEAIDAMIAQAD